MKLRLIPVLLLFIILSAVPIFGQGDWKVNSKQGIGDLISVYFTSKNDGWVAGDRGYLAYTKDRGKTWTRKQLGTNANINEIYFRNKKQGYLVAGRTMYKTDDGGKVWKEGLDVNPSDFVNGIPEFLSIRFNSKDQGFIVGSILSSKDENIIVGSLILRTVDGGKNWSRIVVPTKAELFHLDFDGKKNGWIVGDAGTILATTDGGRNWTLQYSGTGESLYSVDFRDENDGFAVGTNGTVLETRDGGQSWKKQNLNTDRTLFRVDFPKDNDGWIVGSNGVIFRTTNRGTRWTRVAPVTDNSLYGLYIEKNFGWSVGKNGVVLSYKK